jgi:hypothetical protein
MSIKYLKKVAGVDAPVRVDVAPVFGDSLDNTGYVLPDNKVNGLWYGSELIEPVDTVSSTDPFSDGSLVAKYRTESNLALVGTDLTEIDTVNYISGLYGNRADLSNGRFSLPSDIIGTGDFTYSCVVEFTDFNATKNLYVNSSAYNGFAGSLIISINSSKIITIKRGNGTSAHTTIFSTSYPFEIDKTYTFSVTNDGNNYSLFIEGELIESNTISIANISNTQIYSSIGANSLVPYSGMYIEQIEVYNRGLTATEVFTIHNQRKYKYRTTPYNPQPTYLNHNGKLVGFEVANGDVVDLHYDIDYPKIIEDTVQFNTVIADEYKGKNACTAWVNFDGQTTPPTIRDSFNVSDVVRVSTGYFEIYFENDMDNTDYCTIGAARNMTVAHNEGVREKTTKKEVIDIYNTATTLTNPAGVYLQTFGGKN